MKQEKRSYRKLWIGLAQLAVGAALIATGICISNAYRVEGENFNDTNPVLSLICQLVAYAGILGCFLGIFNVVLFWVHGRVKKPVAGGQRQDFISVFPADYRPATLPELRETVLHRLERGGFSPLNGRSDVFCRVKKRGRETEVFYFTALPTPDGTPLVESVLELERQVLAAHLAKKGGAVEIQCFIPVDFAEESALALLTPLTLQIFQSLQPTTLCGISLYDLSQNRVLATCAHLIFRGNYAVSMKKFITAFAAGKGKLPEAESPEKPPSSPLSVSLPKADSYELKVRNLPFVLSASFGGTLLLTFLIGLIAYASGASLPTFLFWAVFGCAFLLPGLVLLYLALLNYRRYRISSDRLWFRRLFGEAELYAGRMRYAERYRKGQNSIELVFLIFPEELADSLPDYALPDDDRRRYLIVTHNPHNAAVLETLFGEVL